MGIVDSFPADCRVEVIVIRRGGRNSQGDLKPETRIPVPDCIIAPRSSEQSGKASDATTSEMYLYRDPDPGFAFASTDQILVPQGSLMDGLWDVGGRPMQTPLGVEVRLKEVG